MIYQGDTYTFILSLTHTDGTTPSVSVTPSIQIINAVTGASVLSVPGNMSLVSGSVLVYKYSWTIPSGTTSGDYFAVVSYAADSIVITGKYLDRVRIGDTRVTGPVALDATVAKDLTVAKDATTAKSTDLATINPNNSSSIIAIKAKTDHLPSDPVSTTLINTLLLLLTDIHDVNLGQIVIDRTVNPRIMTIKRVADNSVLATFALSETTSSTSRTPQ